MKNIKIAVAAGLASASVVASSSAHAAVPTEMKDAFSTLVTDAGLLLTAAVGVFVAVRGGVALFKVARQFFGASGA